MRQRHCFANAYYLFLSVLYFVLGLIPFGGVLLVYAQLRQDSATFDV